MMLEDVQLQIMLKHTWPFCLCGTFSTPPAETSLLRSRFTMWPPCLTSFGGAHCLHPSGTCSPLWPDLMLLLHSRYGPHLSPQLFSSSPPCIRNAANTATVPSSLQTCIRDQPLPGSLLGSLLASSKMPLLCAPWAHLYPGIIILGADYLHAVCPLQEPDTSRDRNHRLSS